MGIKVPFISEIAPDTYAVNEFGLDTFYVLVGMEKALLIDTGCGVCDLLQTVRNITDKPVVTVLTHGHLDHCGGMGCFEEVYLNEKDIELAESFKAEEARTYADSFGKAGSYEIYDYSPDSIKEIKRIPHFLSLNDGDKIDIGGRVIEAFEIPGHTQGGVALLDAGSRIIFSGDCCNINLLAQSCSVETTLRGLRKFDSLSDRFDQNYNGHVGYMAHLDCLSQPKMVPHDLMTICEMILNGQGKPEPFVFLGYPLNKMKYGCAGMSYDPARIMDH
ncbi:MAG: MBL fold metallo-hydrolase [Lachnospiraceae bacterium]|jgi:glyoxylase-like metal-dependent hydrolase (beta-lactamase superfamily II)|nr:MBL fold metallo-hydrolase [Lachnospiraceae bacterium]